MADERRLRSLDEFEPPAWHRRPVPRPITIPMMLVLVLVLAAAIGGLLGVSL